MVNSSDTQNNAPLELGRYRKLINLERPFAYSPPSTHSTPAESALSALLFLLEEQGQIDSLAIAQYSLAEQRRLLQHLLTIRPATPFLPLPIQQHIDQVRQFDLQQKRLVNAQTLPTVAEVFASTTYPAANQTVLWQGDISTLVIDGIVNAANERMLGCFQPFHNCIDNVINTAAGPRLREDCHQIMQAQGYLEGTGWAKVTRAYNLPSRFVLHTVGPIVEHERPLTDHDRQLLAQAYRSVLDLSAQINLTAIAFCCISTGVFGFPKEPAAQIALDTVADWLATHDTSIMRVVFNVFADADLTIYQQKLG